MVNMQNIWKKISDNYNKKRRKTSYCNSVEGLQD